MSLAEPPSLLTSSPTSPALSLSVMSATTNAFSTSAPSSSASPPPPPPSLTESRSSAHQDDMDVDQQILEALRSKDRLYVLKLGEQMEGLINDRRPRIDLTPATSYQRLLVHRCSAYYKLSPESDPATKIISVSFTMESKIPVRRLSDLVPAESTAQPAFKIMRRAPRKPRSQADSVVGEDGEFSDIEPSEAGSVGGRSNATGSSKKHMTLEEREAAYNEARSRIFMNFEEKEKEKEKDMSASSSTFSLISGSASTSGGGGGSSVGDLDDSVSSPATESEWSGPITRDKKEPRRGGSGNSNSASSQRSLRSTAPSFNTNSGSSSSRDSRASSPSFQYPSLYEPSPPTSYDPSPVQGQPPNPGTGYMAPYVYHYPPQGQVPPPPGYAYPYYPPYQYHPPPQNPSSDPNSPTGGDLYSHLHQQHVQSVQYMSPYAWVPPLGLQHPQPSVHPQHPGSNHSSPPPHQQLPPQYQQPYMPPYAPYPMAGYYQPPPPPPGQLHHPPQQMPPPHIPGQVYPGNEVLRMPNGRNGAHHLSGTNSPARSRTTSSSPGGANKRNVPPNARSAWSFGPGVGASGYAGSLSLGGGETVGPRLSASMRRTSGASSTGSGSAGNRTPAGDEASSTASSSTTSSSSRRTYTSAASSQQHPLPPRPDWAVGLKPEPTLHAIRHHDTTATDFPPLTSASSDKRAAMSSEKRSAPANSSPVASGAWGNASSTRSILMPPANSYSSAVVHHPPALANGNGGPARAEDAERERNFERPQAKPNTELWTPRRNGRTPEKERGEREKERTRGESVAGAILAEKVAAMSVEDQTVAAAENAAAVPT